jgi:hypothetical protein
VTAYSARQLLALAEAAGWSESAATEAVAVALAFSAGQPGRHVVDAGPHPRDYRGLWGVRADLVHADPPPDLIDPAANAYYAHALWRAHGASWRWQPAAKAAGMTVARQVAAAAVQLGPAPVMLPHDTPPGVIPGPVLGQGAGRSVIRAAFDAGARALFTRRY